MSEINIDNIMDLYYGKNESTYQIAKKFKTYPNKIKRLMEKNGCELRTSSEAQKIALDSGRSVHPTDGKERTMEEKLKISSSVANHWDEMSEEKRKDVADQARVRWNSMSKAKRDDIRSKASDAIRKSAVEGSKLEKYLTKELRLGGYLVQVHKKDLIPTQKLEIDLFLPELKTIIEIDGPSHFLPIWGEEKLRKQHKADDQKSGLILSRGYIIIRVKNLNSFVSLKIENSLRTQIFAKLEEIQDSFPPEKKRFIEIEI